MRIRLTIAAYVCCQGACVLSMLRDFLTPEVFNLGIIRYLKKHSYQNTVNADLWDSLTNVSSLFDVKKLRTLPVCVSCHHILPCSPCLSLVVI